MACTDCASNIWQQKLGRCRRCMWFNFFLLLASACASYFLWLEQPRSVQAIAALFTLFSSALLMLLHTTAFIYYRCTKGDKRNPK